LAKVPDLEHSFLGASPMKGSPEEALDWTFKALPAGESEIEIEGIAARRWNVLAEDLMLPVAVLRESALENNLNWMKRFCQEAGVEICPHGKTTMAPKLFERQLAAGAWGITAATVAQVRVYRKHGIRRIILANQLIGRQNINYVLTELERDPEFDFYCLVDSREGADLLNAALNGSKSKRNLQVLLEIGIEGGRTGVRKKVEALQIAERIALSPNLRLRGIEAFEGIVQAGPGEEGELRVRQLMEEIAEVAEHCFLNGLFAGKPILTAGGSSYFDIVADVLANSDSASRFTVVLRSGCYVTHDSEFYEEMIKRLLLRTGKIDRSAPALLPAIELWAYVHSRPEPRRVIAGLGKRDASFDIALPRPLGWVRTGSREVGELGPDHRTVRLDDHHAYLDVPPNSPLQVGDLMYFGISHPCTTFDRWPAMYVVDDQRNVIDVVRTYF